MKKRSLIVQVLSKYINTIPWMVFIDATSKAKTKYKIKLCSPRVSSGALEQAVFDLIKEIPHILDVKYHDGSSKSYSDRFRGYVIHTDIKPSEIKLPKKFLKCLQVTEKKDWRIERGPDTSYIFSLGGVTKPLTIEQRRAIEKLLNK